ncbi:MAG TPA: hypothetical protein V6D22_25070 [Candidatus Obscuribacterales bacterium]
MTSEIRDDLISSYVSRFVNQTKHWGKHVLKAGGLDVYYQKPEQNTFGGRYPYEAVSHSLIRRMLDAEITCSWAAIDEGANSRWLCFDSDVASGDIDKIADVLRRWDFAVLKEGARPGRDGHLWLLFSHPLPAKAIRRFAMEVLAHAGVKPENIEVFPKHDRGYSQIRAPLSVNLKPTANRIRGWFEVPPKDVVSQLEWLKEQQLNDSYKVDLVAQRLFALDASRCRQRAASQRPANISDLKERPAAEVARMLEERPKKSGSGWLVRCPAHEDDRASLKIHDGDQRLLVTCFAGCARTEILKALRQRGVV